MPNHKGFIWTAYDLKTNQPTVGMQQLFAFTRNDATARFQREYGKAFDTVGHYLIGDSFSQWEGDRMSNLSFDSMKNLVGNLDKQRFGETIAEARGEEVCSECGERIPNDDAVIHYHPGAVIEEAI